MLGPQLRKWIWDQGTMSTKEPIFNSQLQRFVLAGFSVGDAQGRCLTPPQVLFDTPFLACFLPSRLLWLPHFRDSCRKWHLPHPASGPSCVTLLMPALAVVFDWWLGTSWKTKAVLSLAIAFTQFERRISLRTSLPCRAMLARQSRGRVFLSTGLVGSGRGRD